MPSFYMLYNLTSHLLGQKVYDSFFSFILNGKIFMGGKSDFSIADDLGSLLTDIESNDHVMCEIVNLNDLLPSLSDVSSALRNKKGRKSFLDPNSLTKASISKNMMIRKSQVHTEKIKEKDLLKARVNELEATIEKQTKQLAQLERRKLELEGQLSDQRTRSRLGSRPKLSVEAVSKEAFDHSDDSNAEYWKEQYEAMDRKYQYLREALSKKGAILRVSAGKSRAIPPPKTVIPQPKFEPNENDLF